MTAAQRHAVHDAVLGWLHNNRLPVTVFDLERFRLGRFPDVSARQLMLQVERMIEAGEIRETQLRGFVVATRR